VPPTRRRETERPATASPPPDLELRQLAIALAELILPPALGRRDLVVQIGYRLVRVPEIHLGRGPLCPAGPSDTLFARFSLFRARSENCRSRVVKSRVNDSSACLSRSSSNRATRSQSRWNAGERNARDPRR
jgi:hypothetical protein